MGLQVSALSVSYGPLPVLRDLSFTVESGHAVALVGRNGAGKSTVLNAIAGLIGRSLGRLGGEIVFDGQALVGLPPHRIARLGVGIVPEDRRVFSDLTVEENLLVGRQPPRPGLPAWDQERLFSLFPNLAERRRHRAGQMSGGEQQMLAVARTLMGNPSLVLLDEPCEGLAPRIVEDMIAALRMMADQGLTLLMSEQSPHVAALICDRVLTLERGCLESLGHKA
jgi:branched-chain amino acid transport system ATP-binding protein